MSESGRRAAVEALVADGLADGVGEDALAICASEPIHVPGAIQPHGWLLTVDEQQRVLHASANVTDLGAGGPAEVLGRPLADVLGTTAAEILAGHVQVFSDLRERNPLLLHLQTPRGLVTADAVLHRPAAADGQLSPLVVVELEAAHGARPFSFSNTYQAVRGSVEALNRARSTEELYEVAAREVRDLTGFDRVMVYRFDPDHNGEVVAEALRDDLEPFLGLHYPASDIPPQARRLYELNWVRIIADVAYTPVPLLALPGAPDPLDLSYSTLRSVSPVHVEYLRNMGVRASMSLSLLQDGRLWGLVACHHYSGPHLPPYGVRAAAEFLASTLSLRLVDRVTEEGLGDRLASEQALVQLVSMLAEDERPLADTLTDEHGVCAVVDADGALADVEGVRRTCGEVADDLDVDALRAWLAADGRDVVSLRSLQEEAPGLVTALPGVAGLLALVLEDGQLVVWLRGELVRTVTWGGDPGEKVVTHEAGSTRIGPRRSFAHWQEVVRGRAATWEERDLLAADRLRGAVVKTLYRRARQQVRTAEDVQRSLLPQHLPVLDGWHVDASYRPAPGGRVGGDWYDWLSLPDGRLVLVVGDVAGHGVHAAAAMAEMRHALRAYLTRGEAPGEAVAALDAHVATALPDQMATLVLVCLDRASGRCELVSVGHPPPLRRRADGSTEEVVVDTSPPLGLRLGPSPSTPVELARGESLVLYTDGLVERRDRSFGDGVALLRSALVTGRGADDVRARTAPGHVDDDVTLLVLTRSG
ncbi:SpoIIE family protein phosphatase [Aquipuribacter sp. SD81]|uniref:SpoIIE family protein phosphatase n=1 Tax=Aquipuribacter sp. SD81 TaxID=3127703 RepID=UPI00301751DB